MRRVTMYFRTKASLDEVDWKEKLHKALNPSYPIALPNCGVLAAVDSTQFVGFQLMFASLRLFNDVPVAVVNLGMTDKQKDWCREQSDLIVLNYRSTIGYQLNWKKWHKPFYLDSSPFKNTIWIDSDIIICKSLSDLVSKYSDKPLFTLDSAVWGNNAKLYQRLPVPRVVDDKYMNNGFFMVNVERDKKILQEWRYCVMEAITNNSIAELIDAFDQGALLWALLKLEMFDSIDQDPFLNYPPEHRMKIYLPTADSVDLFFERLNESAKQVTALHYHGEPKPWKKWNELIKI